MAENRTITPLTEEVEIAFDTSRSSFSLTDSLEAICSSSVLPPLSRAHIPCSFEMYL